MAIGFRDGLGSFTQIMELAQLVRHARQGLCHGGPDGGLAVRDDPDNGHRERLLYLLDQECQIVVSGREQTPGQEDLAGEAIAQHPEDFMADLGLEAIEGQDDATTDVGDTVEARRVLQREGDQFVVTLQEMRDRPWGTATWRSTKV